MKYLYKGQIVTANSKEEAVKIVASNKDVLIDFNEWNENNPLYKNFVKQFSKYFDGKLEISIGEGGGYGFGRYYDHSVYVVFSKVLEKKLKKAKIFDEVDEALSDVYAGYVNVKEPYTVMWRTIGTFDGSKSWWKQLYAMPKFKKMLDKCSKILKEAEEKLKK